MSRVAQLGLRQRQLECPPHIDVHYERAGPLQKSEELVCLGDDVMDVSLCSAEALMGVPSGSHNLSPCASKLCRPVPNYEFRKEGRDFLDLLALQHIRGVEFYIHKVLVYHVSGGTDRI